MNGIFGIRVWTPPQSPHIPLIYIYIYAIFALGQNRLRYLV